jgi:hypothetical protein
LAVLGHLKKGAPQILFSSVAAAHLALRTQLSNTNNSSAGMLIAVPSLNFAVVTVGNFLLAKRSPSAPRGSVCLIREVRAASIKVSWWLTIEELSNEGYMRLPPPLALTDYDNVLKCRIKEVCEMCSELCDISINDITDIAFVFHVDTLQRDFMNCAGMSRVYFTRYRCRRDGTLSYFHGQMHSPFSMSTIESFPSRMWFFIMDVKANVEKMLNDTKQYQSCRKMVTMKCSLESWLFFCFMMTNSGAVIVNFNRRCTEKNLHCDLSLSSSSNQKLLQIIRLDTEATLSWARGVFGTTFGIGTRNRAPKKGDAPVTLHYGDMVNVALVSDGNNPAAANRFHEFVATPGIDFVFDQRTRSLKIRARYTCCCSHSNDIAPTLREIFGNLPPRPQENPNLLTCVVVGTFFMREDVLLEVLAIDGNNVLVAEAEDSANQFNLNLNEAAQLINDYIS